MQFSCRENFPQSVLKSEMKSFFRWSILDTAIVEFESKHNAEFVVAILLEHFAKKALKKNPIEKYSMC